MTKLNRFLPVIPFILLLMTGCVAAVQSSGPSLTVQTPPPVTPIAAPDGIRDTLTIDPRVMMASEQEPAEAALTQEAQTGLGLCHSNGKVVQPVEAYANGVESFQATVYAQVCGWQRAGMPIDVRVELPNGEVLEEQVETEKMFNNSNIYASYHWSSDAPDIFGTVHLTFSDRGGLLSDGNNVTAVAYEIGLPTEPHVYTFENGTAWLYGFAPNEEVQVLRYDVSERGFVEWEGGGGITETYTLVNQQTITVDEDGNKALLNFGAEEYGPYGPASLVVAVGASSGEISDRQMLFVESSVLVEK